MGLSLQVKRLFLVMLVLVPGYSCGYQLVGSAVNLPPEIKKIFIPPFLNKTNEPNLEQVFTDALRQRFMSIERLEVVEGEEGADAVLLVTLTGYNENVPIAFSDQRIASAYRLEINLDAVIKSPEKTFWKKDNMFVFAEYDVSSDPSTTRINENEAKEETAAEFARDFFSYLY